MADKKPGGGGGKKGPSAVGRRTYYKVVDGKVTVARQNCPKCGPGIFLGQHANRKSCGKCGYTEFQKK